jgi:hypothetical protein
MQQASSSKNSPKVSSISRRFSYALIGIITLLLIAFAAVVILFNISRMEKWMEMRLDNAIMFAQNSLPIPLWNMDYTVVNDFVEALFLDESIVYSKISWKDQLITEKKRPGFQLKKIKLQTPLQSLKGPDLIAKSSNIYFKDSVISELVNPYYCSNLAHIHLHHQTVYLFPITEITGISVNDRPGRFGHFCR